MVSTNKEAPDKNEKTTTATKAGQQQVASYLASNPEFLENYVVQNVDLETLERWVIRKARSVQKENGGKIFFYKRFHFDMKRFDFFLFHSNSQSV